MAVMVLFCRKLVPCSASRRKEPGALRNKHIRVNGEFWSPMLTFDYNEDGNITNYGGIMYELLLFMQQAKGFTFDIISEARSV